MSWSGRAAPRILMLTAMSFGGALSVHAQQPLGYPINGLYLGAAGGFNLKGNESIKNLSSNLRTGSTGISTPNLNIATGLGGAAFGAIGWGFGNGLRAEVEFDYRGNGFSHVSGLNAAGFGASTSASGSEQLWGPMFNVDYDFVDVVPWVIPYVGVGIGYQRAHLSNFQAVGSGTAAALSPVLGSNDTRASFAVQGILGAAMPLDQVPGLSLTAEYRILALTGTRTYNAGLTATVPGGGRVTRVGTFQLGHEYNNTFLFGVRYAFGVTPPPPPAPAPVAAPAPTVQPARSYLVFFDWDKATLTDRARQIIKEAADNSTHVRYTRIEVNGYTDTSGSPKYNQQLSVRRADAVAAELVRDGVPREAITIQGFGETHLLVPTAQGVREPQNRRVEILIR